MPSLGRDSQLCVLMSPSPSTQHLNSPPTLQRQSSDLFSRRPHRCPVVDVEAQVRYRPLQWHSLWWLTRSVSWVAFMLSAFFAVKRDEDVNSVLVLVVPVIIIFTTWKSEMDDKYKPPLQRKRHYAQRILLMHPSRSRAKSRKVFASSYLAFAIGARRWAMADMRGNRGNREICRNWRNDRKEISRSIKDDPLEIFSPVIMR